MQKDSEALTKDYLPGYPNITVFQHKAMFRVNTDTSLLGYYLNVNEGDRVLDIGTNNGALLLYASMYNYKELIGIDINEDALVIANLNMHENNVNNYKFLCINIKDYFDEEGFDVIVSNPPYFNTKNEGLKNQNNYLKMARHEEFLVLEDLIQGVKRNLKNNGVFYLIHVAFRFEEIKKMLNQYGLFIEEYTKVKDERKENNHVILLKISKNNMALEKEKETIVIKR